VSTTIAAGIDTKGAKAWRAGSHRTVSPEETLLRVAPLLAPLGITRVAEVTGLDRIGIPVWIACRPNSRSLSVSQGKGLTDAAARVSAVMECIELHHAERPVVPLLLASAAEMAERRLPTVDVEALAGTTTSRYHPDRPMLWTEATDLMQGGTRWLPFEVVHTSAVLPAPTGSGCFSSTSNGLASGNHPLEAAVHAICEVIERDAAAVWQAGSEKDRAATRVDLGTVVDADCRHVLDLYARAGVSVTVMDMTSDVGVPAFLCEIADAADAEGVTRYTGMGCHLWPEIALSRALTEAAQSRLTYITGSRDDLTRGDYRAVRGGTHLAEDRTASTGRPFRAVVPGPETESGSFSDDLTLLYDRLRAAGLESLLMVDLTSPELGIPVVRVVIPGMEGPDDEPTYVRGRRAMAAVDARR
jgi:ribosomal protein S12 methylthiotransferase accessory factor